MASIRLSTMQIYNNGLSGLLDSQKAVHKTQAHLSADKKVLTPGDDPIAAARILQLNQELAQISQHNQSLSTLENRLQREDVALSGISDLILGAQELITQSGSAVMNAEQRGYLAVELQSVVDAMAQLMNTRDAGGEHIFSGFQGGTQPFVKGPDGIWSYAGDEGQRSIVIGPNTSVAASDPGSKVFMGIDSVAPGLAVSASAGNRSAPPASISSAYVHDREAFGNFYPENVVIEFRPVNEIQPPAVNYVVRQVSDGRMLSAGNMPYVPGGEIQFGGASVRINGNPEPGDSFSVQSTGKTGLLEGLEDYIRTLRSTGDGPGEQQALSDRLGDALGNLDKAQTRLLETRASVGSRLNLVDSARANNLDFENVVRESLSEVADLDYAAAISQLTHESFILEAAQASFARVSKLSLFNFL